MDDSEPPGYKPTTADYKLTTDPKTCLLQVGALTNYIDSTINSQSLKALSSLLKTVYRAEKNVGEFLKTKLDSPLMLHQFKCSLRGLLGRRNNITDKSIELLWAETGTPRLFPRPQPIPLYSS